MKHASLISQNINSSDIDIHKKTLFSSGRYIEKNRKAIAKNIQTISLISSDSNSN